jgi:hypothetical protein
MGRSVPFLLLLICACATPRPVFYPNDKLKAVGPEAAQHDVDECLAQSKEYIKTNNLKPIARKTGWGAATGAAMGAALGLITGDIGRAASEGAAVGGVGGAMGGAYENSKPDAITRAFTERCLAEMGYSTLGWK